MQIPFNIICCLTDGFVAVGNRRFRSVVSDALEEYTEATSKWAKSMVAAKLVGVIHRDGGRFLKQRKGNDEEWYELSLRDAKAKASHAIRDAIAAKEKTKAIKAGTASKATPRKSAGPKKVQPKQNESARKKKAQDIMDSGNRYDGPSLGSPLSLSSIGRPVFGLGGPHPTHFSAFHGSSVQDQIQHLRSQDYRNSSGTSFHGGSVQDQIQHLRSQDFRNSTGSFSSSFAGLTQLRGLDSMEPMGGVMGSMGAPPFVRGSFPREIQLAEAKQQGPGNIGSEQEDSDNDFLSLIDNVLGPMHQSQREDP